MGEAKEGAVYIPCHPHVSAYTGRLPESQVRFPISVRPKVEPRLELISIPEILLAWLGCSSKDWRFMPGHEMTDLMRDR